VQLRAIIDALDRAVWARSNSWRSKLCSNGRAPSKTSLTSRGSDSDDAELAALRAEVERLRAAAQPALPLGRAPRGRPGRPARRRASCWTLVRAQTSTACVAIASGCAGTGRGRPARWLGRPRLAVDHAARSVAPERGSAASGAGFSPRIAYSSDDMVVIQSLVASGMGVATLPEPRSKRAGRQGSTPQNSRTTPVRSMPSRTATTSPAPTRSASPPPSCGHHLTGPVPTRRSTTAGSAP